MPEQTSNGLLVTDRGLKPSALGPVRLLKIHAPDFRPLPWGEVWAAFSDLFPTSWALQVFPPVASLVDGKSVYHLWVLEGDCPSGLDLQRPT